MTPRGPSWLERSRGLQVEPVAQALGLEPGKPAMGRPTYACPACGAPTRHTKARDTRGAVGLTGDGEGWSCFQCEAKGDAVDMVACSLEGGRFRDLPREGQARVRAWLSERWPELGDSPRARSGSLPARPQGNPQARPSNAPSNAPRPAPLYPPPGEVEALWSRARPVVEDSEVRAYLEGRALEPEAVASMDLCRALPLGSTLPRWAWGPGGSWLDSGRRLLCPLHDSRGVLRSLTAKAEGEKSIPPRGFERRGLVLADGLGLQVLQAGGLPSWWDRDVPLRVVLAEGEPDWLTWATGPEALMDNGHGPACLGLFNGGLPAELVARLPRGSEVLIDEQGDESRGDGLTAAETYTRRIQGVLAGRARSGEITVKVKRR